jgi:hypothetical protein
MTRQEHRRFEELLDRHDEQCDIDAARAVHSSPRNTTAAQAAISIAPRKVSTSISRPAPTYGIQPVLRSHRHHDCAVAAFSR